MRNYRKINLHSNFKNIKIKFPFSKSYTARALICASLSKGVSKIINPSNSYDTQLLIRGLRQFGVKIINKKNYLFIRGIFVDKKLLRERKVYIGNAGTSFRFLTVFASLQKCKTILYGDKHLNKRPIQNLVNSLIESGLKIYSTNGFAPIVVEGGNFLGGKIKLDSSKSSQFLSALLLCSPYAQKNTIVILNRKIPSYSYVKITIDIMKKFGVDVKTQNENKFFLTNSKKYNTTVFQNETDISSVNYFLLASAITEKKIKFYYSDINLKTLQSDIKFLFLLKKMGAKIFYTKKYFYIVCEKLKGISIDMNDFPDSVPTLVIASLFANGITKIKNISHLVYKETNRLVALKNELTKIGAKVKLTKSSITILPQQIYSGAKINTYDDHRIAMSFAIAGLKIRGMEIENPNCVNKSFPNFWKEFRKLEED